MGSFININSSILRKRAFAASQSLSLLNQSLLKYMRHIITDANNEKLSLWQVVKSVLMSFLGVQKNEIRERDFAKGNPLVFILVGLFLTVAFILILVIIVHLVLKSA